MRVESGGTSAPAGSKFMAHPALLPSNISLLKRLSLQKIPSLTRRLKKRPQAPRKTNQIIRNWECAGSARLGTLWPICPIRWLCSWFWKRKSISKISRSGCITSGSTMAIRSTSTRSVSTSPTRFARHVSQFTSKLRSWKSASGSSQRPWGFQLRSKNNRQKRVSDINLLLLQKWKVRTTWTQLRCSIRRRNKKLKLLVSKSFIDSDSFLCSLVNILPLIS